MRIFVPEDEEFTQANIRLRITSAAGTFSGRYRLCVRGPEELRECKRFLMEPGQNRNIDTKRWARYFTGQGAGEYRVTWHKFGSRLGEVLTFTLGPAASD